MHRTVVLFLCLASWALRGVAQTDAYRQYIETYKIMAIDQMQRYRIPASITLAQGLIESNAGRSTLAVAANNHFGIKTGGQWTGPYILRNDDAPNEQFRKYNSPADSYEDHSLFLSRRGRYSSLFYLSPTDYAGWAAGLKAAGYATNPRYAEILVGIIERYGLSQYDRMRLVYQYADQRQDHGGIERPVHLCNDIVYVVASRGDSFETIATDTGISESKLRKFNEVGKDYMLAEGDIVYLSEKKKHVTEALRMTLHTVQPGESMYSIAQRYGVRMKYLYKWNLFPKDYELAVGDRLVLK